MVNCVNKFSNFGIDVRQENLFDCLYEIEWVSQYNPIFLWSLCSFLLLNWQIISSSKREWYSSPQQKEIDKVENTENKNGTQTLVHYERLRGSCSLRFFVIILCDFFEHRLVLTLNVRKKKGRKNFVVFWSQSISDWRMKKKEIHRTECKFFFYDRRGHWKCIDNVSIWLCFIICVRKFIFFFCRWEAKKK